MATFDREAAKRSGYTDQEIETFLKSSPAPVAKSQSITQKIGEALMSIVKPTTDYVGKLTRMEAGPLPAIQKAATPGKFDVGTFVKTLAGIGGEQLKPAANITSLLVPAAKAPGFVAGLAPGAVSGALMESSQEGATAKSIFGGGALGAVTGGVFNKLLGGAKTAQNVGKAISKSAVPPKVKPSVFMGEQEEALAALEKEIGLTGSAEARKLKLPEIFKGVETKLQTAVTGKQTGLTSDQIRKSIIDEVIASPQVDIPEEEIALIVAGKKLPRGASAYARELQYQLDTVGKQIKNGVGDELLGAKRNIKPGSGAFEKMSGASTTAPTAKEAVRVETYRSLNNILKTNIPEAADLLKIESSLMDLPEGYAVASQRFDVLPPFGLRVSARPSQAIASKVGNFLQDAGIDGEKAAPILKAMKSPIVASIVSSSSKEPTETKLTSNGTIESGMDDIIKDFQTIDTQKGGISEENLRNAMIMDLATTGGKHVVELKAIAEIGAGGADAKKKSLLKSNAERIVNELERLYFEGGLASGRVGGIGAAASSAVGGNPNLKVYSGARNASLPALARALGEVGNLASEEQKRYLQTLPSEFSTMEEAIGNFNTLRVILGLPQSSYARK